MRNLTRTAFLTLSLLLAACAGASQDVATVVQTEAMATLNAQAAEVQAEMALQTAEAQNAALQATIDAQASEAAAATLPPAETSTALPEPTATRFVPPATAAPTSAPGIGARFMQHLTCNGTRFAMLRVLNTGPQTYQSAVVVLSDSVGDEIRRSDGNNEFLPSVTSCPGSEQPTLGPRGETFVSVSSMGLNSGDTYLIRVTVCTEKGYRGDCYSSTTQFVN